MNSWRGGGIWISAVMHTLLVAGVWLLPPPAATEAPAGIVRVMLVADPNPEPTLSTAQNGITRRRTPRPELARPVPAATAATAIGNAVHSIDAVGAAPARTDPIAPAPVADPIRHPSVNAAGADSAERGEIAGREVDAVAEVASAARGGTEIGANTGSSPEADAALARFIAEVRAQIERAKRYPWEARLRGAEGVARLRFRITASGAPDAIEVTESSRSRILDDEAVATVGRVGRFPQPPHGATVNVQVPLVFRLDSR